MPGACQVGVALLLVVSRMHPRSRASGILFPTVPPVDKDPPTASGPLKSTGSKRDV